MTLAINCVWHVGPHSDMRDDIKQTERREGEKRKRTGSKNYPLSYPNWEFLISCFFRLFFYLGGLTWLWVDWRSLPWIFLELDAFYREDGCSWKQQRVVVSVFLHSMCMFTMSNSMYSLSASVWTCSPKVRKYDCLSASSAETLFFASNCRHTGPKKIKIQSKTLGVCILLIIKCDIRHL